MQCRWGMSKIRSAFSLLSACLVVAACSSTRSGVAADGGAADAGANGANGADGGNGGGGGSAGGDGVATGAMAPPSATGTPLVDRLGAAAAACGRQSGFTVPGGWEIVAIGDKGCTVWVPPGWVVEGSHTYKVTALADSSGVEGFVGLAGATRELATCAPAEVTSGILGGFAENGYASPEVLWHYEGIEAFGGSDWSTGHAVFTANRGSAPLIGYLWVLALPTIVACDVVSLGFWEPQSRIEADTCKLTQILSSVKCPSGGGCDDASCSQSCRAEGRSGGTCDPTCQCY